MREFLAAAMLSEEPGPAERATRIAHELELTEQGLTAGARWRELAPDDERPAWYLGVFETRANRVPRAIAEFTTFIRSIDDRRTGFALVLEALGDEPYTGTATAIMRSLNETFPNVPAGQYALARLALRSGDFELALENAEAASQSNADWIEAQLLYARTLLVTGRTEDSLAIAADLAGRHDELEVQLQYAELLLSAGRPREAETRLNEILADNPGLPEATRALAFLAMTEQRIEDAKRYFNDLRGEPNYRSEAFYYLGRLAETESDFLQATRSYARVTEGTHAVEAQLRTARILYAEQNDRESAVRHLRDFGAANPRFATDMLVAQAQLLLQMEQPAEAMRVARRGARVDARRSGAALRSCAALRDSGAERRRARRARRRRGAARTKASTATPTTARCATRWRCSTRTRTATARRSTCSSRSPRTTPTTPRS